MNVSLKRISVETVLNLCKRIQVTGIVPHHVDTRTIYDKADKRSFYQLKNKLAFIKKNHGLDDFAEATRLYIEAFQRKFDFWKRQEKIALSSFSEQGREQKG